MMRSILHHFFLFFIATIIQFRELQSQYYTGILAGGNGCGWTGDGGPASSAKVNSPYGIWGDTVGNIYFSEFVELRVRVINSAGIINTIIGTGVSSTSGVGGPGLSTSLDSVSDLVGDTTSNLYIAGNFFTWRYSFSTLQVVKIMGASASNSYGGDGGPATSAAVSDVIGVAISTSGTLYIVDCGNCIIRAVNLATNIITTFAGTPTSCDFSGEGGAATSAKLRYPYGIWMSSNNDLYIADAQNYRIRRVTNNIITTIAGTGSNFLGQDGVAATNSGLYFPVGVAGDSLGTIYIAEHSGCRVRAVQSGIITTVLGTGTCVTFVSTVQVATNTPVSPLRQLWVNTIGTLYVVESATCIVRYVYSNIPTVNPTSSPTNFPTVSPSLLPTYVTTASPSCLPTFQPSVTPTVVPPTYTPSFIPSVNPSCVPSTEPTFSPSFSPSPLPSTLIPSHIPTHYPTSDPSSQPTSLPSIRPSTVPSSQPSASPSGAPSIMPTSLPSVKPSMIPAGEPTSTPSTLPSAIPSSHPTGGPSSQPSSQPSSHPTSQPSVRPSIHPSSRPTSQPSVRLSIHPSSRPTSQPSVRPSIHPSSRPTSQPSVRPSIHPSSRPTSQPSVRPSMQTSQPSLLLTVSPSPGTSFPIHLATVSPSFVPNVVPFVPEARCPSLIPSQLPHPSISSAPSQFITCFPNTSSWKEVLFLFGSFSSDSQSAKVLDALSFLLSPSSIIFGSKSFSSSPLVVNVSCSSTSCHYPVAHISASYKRDTTSRAAVVPGDVNGDAYNDLIVCSPLTSLCNIYFGKEEDGLRNVMIGVTIYGPSSSSTPSSPAATFFGFSVAGAEDLNEDGLADVLVSSLTGRAVYVIYGRRSWSSMFRVSQMRSRVDGYKIVADSSTTMTGISVSGVGDMNGDGRKDVALSIQRGGLFMVYVIWGEGETGGNDLLLGEVRNGMKGFSVTGEQGYYTGLSISGVGDVNNDGLNDLLVGAIPYPDRTKNLQQKSYVILGSSARFSDLGLGGNRVDVVSIVGGGFLVSGPGDVNDDGIDDIMITNVREYLGKGNAYIISYPSRMSSSPSLVPSSFPSLVPSHPTRSQPSSSFPSSSPSSSYLSSNITSPSSLPNRITTLKPSRSFRPSNIPIIRSPNYSPAMSAVPSLRQTTRSPTVRPSFISARTNSYSPSVNPSRCRSPSIVPTLVASLAPSSHSYIVRVVNSTSLASSVIIYGMEGASERFEISSISSDGRRRSGWSGTILGGRGRKVYVIYPKDSSQPMNRIILEDFEKKSDVLDLSHISHIRSRVDLTYRTNPLTLFLPDNQKIVLSSYQTMNDLKDENFLFQSDTSSSSSTSSSKVSLKELSLIVPLFGAMIVLLVWISPFSVCNKDDENKEVDNIGIYRDEDMTEDKHKQVHQVMNVNNIEDVGEAREEVHHINNHVEKHYPLIFSIILIRLSTRKMMKLVVATVKIG